MAFVYELITAEDVKQYGLDEDYPASKIHPGPYSNLEKNEVGGRWVINREEGVYLRFGGLALKVMAMGKPGCFSFLMNFKGG